MNISRLYSISVCFVYGLEEKDSKSEVIFAVCRLPWTSCLTSLFYFRTGGDAACSWHVLLAEAPRRIWQCVKWLKWGWLAYTTPTVRDISTFAVLCSVIRPFMSLYFMLCNKEEFQIELSLKIVLCQICIGHRSASFQLLSACCLVECDSSVICHNGKAHFYCKICF